MLCPSCATELLHAANFCPVCGARLDPGEQAPLPPDAAAGERQPPHVVLAPPAPGEQPPAGTPPDVTPPPAPGAPDNVVYLTEHQHPGVPPNPHAADYSAASPPPNLVPGPGAAVHHPGATPSPGHQAGSVTSSPGPTADQARAAEAFFSGTEDAFWREDVDRDARALGTGVAIAAVLTFLSALTWYGAALRQGFGGAEAGGLVLCSALMWIWYLSLPRTQQHETLLRGHARVRRFVDERVDPVQRRTARRLERRRERDRYRDMRSERSRRVGELGELAYRRFRQGTLDPELHAQAQRVMAIEQQMLMQDQRLERLHEEDSG